MTMFWLSGAWLAGILAGSRFTLRPWQWLVLAALFLGGLLWQRSQSRQRLLLGLLLVACLGAARYHPSLPNSPLIHYHGLSRGLTIRGRVVDYPAQRDSLTGLTVAVESILTDGGSWQPQAGLILANVDPFSPWAYGDRVELRGNLQEPPASDAFDYRAYLARRGIHTLMTANRAMQLGRGPLIDGQGAIYRLRARLLDSLVRLFPEPEASLLAGILLGVETGISDPVRQAFDRTGTTHVIAISGFNISIIAALFLAVFGRWLGARRGALAAGAGIALYTLLVGADAAVVRAAVMGGLSLAAQRLGRQTLGYASLGAAASGMTLVDPHLLWDVSFQLSFAATFGLLLYGDRFQAGFVNLVRRRGHVTEDTAEAWAGPVSEYFLLTLAAQLTTLPLILYHFSRLSLIAPLANLVILPVQPALMILGGLATGLGAVWPPLGDLAAAVAWPFPAFTIRVVEFFAGLPLASITLPPLGSLALAGLYLFILVVTWLADRIPAHGDLRPPTWLQAVALAGLAVATLIAWQRVAHLPDDRTRLTFLATHPGDGVLIETRDGRRLLIDGGASALALGEALDRRLPPFERSLDWLIVTKADEQTIGGIARLVERYAIGGAIVTAAPATSAYRRLAQDLSDMGRPIGSAGQGMRLDLGEGAALTFLTADGDDLLLALEDGSARILLVPRASAGWMGRMRDIGLAPGWSALMLPAAGDGTITPPAELLRLNPRAVLLSVDPGQVPDRPSTALLEALDGRAVLRTDQLGWIELSTDGSRLWVIAQRPLPGAD
jgi:competence protein ComEC